MSTYTDRVCAALRGLIESRTEWDEPPGLYFLYAEDGAMRLSEQSVVPDEMWESDVPTFVLARLAGATVLWGPLLRRVSPENLLGAVFRCETWGVRTPMADTAARAHAEALHRQRRLNEHPDRVEQRSAWAVLRDGGQYVAMQDRGSDEIRTERLSAEVSGLIPDSLARITRAMCDVAVN